MIKACQESHQSREGQVLVVCRNLTKGILSVLTWISYCTVQASVKGDTTANVVEDRTAFLQVYFVPRLEKGVIELSHV